MYPVCVKQRVSIFNCLLSLGVWFEPLKVQDSFEFHVLFESCPVSAKDGEEGHSGQGQECCSRKQKPGALGHG